MKVVIYARFSSNGQREESIEGQVRVCTEYAKRNDYKIVGQYCDRAVSGRTDARSQFQKLIADSKKGKFDAVLVYTIDRFGRDIYQAIVYEHELNQRGIVILSATEPLTTDPAGRFFRYIMMANAQFYSDELAQKIRRGMDSNGEKCLCTGGNIALGYKVNEESKRFEVDPNTAPIVKLIFEMYADGKTVAQITTHLNSLGYQTARGASFNKNSLHTILKNKRYIGIYTYKGKETPGGMPRIISDELFEKVGSVMEKNKKAPARAKAKNEYLLTTKLFCGHCKSMMTGFSGKGHLGKNYRYYICNERKDKKCKKKMVSKEYIEGLVLAECRKVLSPTNIAKIAAEIARLCEEEKDTSNLTYLKKNLANNERKQRNMIDAIAECEIESIRKTLYQKVQTLENEHTELEYQIAVESAVLPTLTEPKIKFFLTSLRDGSITDIKYKKMLIAVLVNTIYLYDDRVTITFNSGDIPVTIDDILLSKISEGTSCPEGLFLKGGGPPFIPTSSGI